MKWRVFVWILRIAFVAAVLYGVWCGAAYFLGKHYFRAGMVALGSDPAQAVQRFEIAAKLQPKNARYRAALGRAALKTGDAARAAEHLQAAADLQPERFDVWHDLGGAYLKANRPAEATRAYQRALQIRPDAPLALEGLAEAATRAGDSKAALEPLRQLWQRSPTDVELAAKLAHALVQQGRYDEALEVCGKIRAKGSATKSQDLRNDAGPTLEGQAWCVVLGAEGDAHRAKGRWADAIIAYQRGLLIDPPNKAALDGLMHLPSDVVRRIATDLSAHAPCLSPDGKRVAFFADGLYAADPSSGEVTRLAAEGVRPSTDRPAWSPDGKRLCYATNGRLHVVNADGTGDRVLVREAAPLPQLAKLGLKAQPTSAGIQSLPAWSPDGNAAAFCLELDNAPDVNVTCVVDGRTGKARSVHHTTGALPKLGAKRVTPAWSADGRVLCGPLLYRPEKQAAGLTIWSADGVVKRQIGLPREGVALGDAQSAVVGVSWSPDARYLAALLRTADPHGRTVLALMPAAEGKTGRIVAKDVAAHRWLDASHVWLLQRTGDSYVTANVRALVSDLQGNLKPDKQPFPVLPIGDWDLSRDRQRLVVAGPARGKQMSDKGLWVFDLAKLRGAKG